MSGPYVLFDAEYVALEDLLASDDELPLVEHRVGGAHCAMLGDQVADVVSLQESDQGYLVLGYRDQHQRDGRILGV